MCDLIYIILKGPNCGKEEQISGCQALGGGGHMALAVKDSMKGHWVM